MNAPVVLSLEQALEKLAEGAAPHRIRRIDSVPTAQALGRVLAAEVMSALDVPPEDNSSMDGYALNTRDVAAAGAELSVAQRIPAGHPGRPLEPGTAARIFTGAQVPQGADTIVMQEFCESLPAADGQGLGRVRVNTVPERHQWIRRKGEDVRNGAIVLHAGTRLTPQALGLAASVGAAMLAVVRRPRVAIFSTGDELVMPGEPLPPGAIYNSNRFTLRGLAEAGGCEVGDLGIVPDRLDATRDALRRAAAAHDVIITSGGVSVGEEDHLKPAIRAEGTLEQWQMAIKPGRPLAFGTVRRDDGSSALVLGLPGNPVSSFLTYVLCVSTVLRAMQGMDWRLPKPVPMRADFDWPRADKRREFMRVRVGEHGALELFPNQSSGVLTSAVWADGFVDNPPGQVIARGDVVRFLPFAELLSR